MIKNYQKIVAVVALLFLFAGNVVAQEKDPAQTLSAFIEMLGKQDVAAARSLATQDSKPMLDMIEMGMTMMKNQAQQKGKTLPAFSMRMLAIGKPFVQGNHATVVASDASGKESITVPLRKENGEWKVVFNQSTLIKMAADKGIDVNKVQLPKPNQ
jgi:hypothetical protein